MERGAVVERGDVVERWDAVGHGQHAGDKGENSQYGVSCVSEATVSRLGWVACREGEEFVNLPVI